MNVDEDPLPKRRKGRSRLRRSLDACFEVGVASTPPIHKVRTKKDQVPQRGAGRALAGRIRRDPLWLDRSNPAKLISRNKYGHTWKGN